MKLTKTFLTSALLGASFYSIHSTAWANIQETQLQQGVAATEKVIFKQPSNFGCHWLNKAMQRLNLIWV